MRGDEAEREPLNAEVAAEEADDLLDRDHAKAKSTEDYFQPFNDLPSEQRNILTVRAIVVGILCGALVNASNIYLGLKSGWTASANIFAVGCLFSLSLFSAD